MITPNHASFLDPPIVGISAPGEVHFLARETLFHSPILDWLIRKLNTHPIARGKGNLNTIRLCIDLLEQGKKVVIFPEGTRTRDGGLKKGQLGVGLLVLHTKCLVIPTYIHGTYEIWNAHDRLPRLKGRTACLFGKPLDFSKMDVKNKKEAEILIAETIMASIADLKAHYLNLVKKHPSSTPHSPK